MKLYKGSNRLNAEKLKEDTTFDMNRAKHINNKIEDGLLCEHCNSRHFYIYVTYIIDDARVYCCNCKRQVV